MKLFQIKNYISVNLLAFVGYVFLPKWLLLVNLSSATENFGKAFAAVDIYIWELRYLLIFFLLLFAEKKYRNVITLTLPKFIQVIHFLIIFIGVLLFLAPIIPFILVTVFSCFYGAISGDLW